jgi:hypothetical protein
MIWWVLVAVLYTKAGPITVSNAFPDRASCDIAEANVANNATHSDQITGWDTLKGCQPSTEAKKA